MRFFYFSGLWSCCGSGIIGCGFGWFEGFACSFWVDLQGDIGLYGRRGGWLLGG